MAHQILRSSLLAIAVLGLVSGCASYDRKTVNVRKLDEYVAKASAGGVSMAAEAFDTPEGSKAILDEDVTEKGYVPVQVVFENATGERVLILRASVELEDSSGRTYRPANSAEVADAVKDNKMAYALLGFGIFSYMSAEDANNDRGADYRQKSLPENLIVSPRRTENGLLFFNVGKGVRINGFKVKAVAELMTSNRDLDLEVTLP
ncbi:MAG: hypothetical protein H6907_18865 [Hyphomicrobiales bacterium]|nr:hypothetical protein [Hyphomicrobiales bacterium]MCP5373797.1 hypothetical protein [Hyphomicrobiales bacterium]